MLGKNVLIPWDKIHPDELLGLDYYFKDPTAACETGKNHLDYDLHSYKQDYDTFKTDNNKFQN